MKAIARRLRKMEAWRPPEDLGIQVVYVNEPPKSPVGESEERPFPQSSEHKPLVTVVYLHEGDHQPAHE